jgi:hypothetical protein
MPKLSAGQRRALELLAGSPNGCTEALMVAQGITSDVLAHLILAGYAQRDHEPPR